MRRALAVAALAVPIAFGVGTGFAHADTDPALGPIQNPSSWSADAVQPASPQEQDEAIHRQWAIEQNQFLQGLGQ